jgi:hypothetical protein
VRCATVPTRLAAGLRCEMHDVGFEARQNETSRTSMEPSRTTLLIKYDRPEHDASDGLIAISSWQIKNMPRHVRDKATVKACGCCALLEKH